MLYYCRRFLPPYRRLSVVIPTAFSLSPLRSTPSLW